MGVVSLLATEMQAWFKTSAGRAVRSKANLVSEARIAQTVKMAGDEVVLSDIAKLGKLGTKGVKQQLTKGEKWLAKRQVVLNHIQGDRRQVIVKNFLRARFKTSEGYSVHAEQTLRTKAGRIAHETTSQEARRIDFVVFKGKQIHTAVEVTSETAPKGVQLAKERAIKRAGGRYLIHPETGELTKLPPRLATVVLRLA